MEQKKTFLTVSSSPHIRTKTDTRSIMLDVLIALVPALIASCYFFGIRSLLVVAVSAAGCVFWEWLYRKLMKKHQTIGDLSAVVTGVLLAFTLPVTIPYWVVIIGDAFAIILVKQLFGGLGKNFMNPALAARAFMLSWPVLMTTWVAPHSAVSLFGSNADAVTAATPMSILHGGVMPDASIMDMFIGNIGGTLGETSALLLLVGGIYLVMRKVISPRIPAAYILTVAVITFIFPKGDAGNLEWMLANLFGGGLMLGAIFMATDYVTSPVTATGQLIYGIGCGLITVFIRYFGSYAEGVSYAILIMNTCAWMLDKVGRPRRFGTDKKAKEAA
ncbi:MAG: RnfABCDGE type electron transport complex subunit D [Ruminococcaceae bacterium]|nr:RnfABCDGE type electron transport complex subunit D [Oscillospiraceae bacterium]